MKNQHTLTQEAPKREKARSIFDQALEHYREKRIYQALQTARYALRISRRNNDYIKVYIHGFIAVIKAELGQKELAAYYCRQALHSLFSYHPAYRSDKKYYQALLRHIEKG